jgi:hypothetical protein
MLTCGCFCAFFFLSQVELAVELATERENLEQQDHALALRLQNEHEPWRNRHDSWADSERAVQKVEQTQRQMCLAFDEERRQRARNEWKPDAPAAASADYGRGFGKPLFSANMSASTRHAPGKGLTCLRCRVPEAAQALYIHTACGAAYCHACLSTYHPTCRNARLLGDKEAAACPKCSGVCPGVQNSPNVCVCATQTSSIGGGF